jgi:hypothetical protein
MLHPSPSWCSACHDLAENRVTFAELPHEDTMLTGLMRRPRH